MKLQRQELRFWLVALLSRYLKKLHKLSPCGKKWCVPWVTYLTCNIFYTVKMSQNMFL
jgi:hypothetical protein